MKKLGLPEMKKPKEILFTSRVIQYAFLSNPFPAAFVAPFGGKHVLFRSAEHYYQAHKTKDKTFRAKIINASEWAKAKYFGSAKGGCPLDPKFEDNKDKIMLRAVAHKFAQNPMLFRFLKDTKDAVLIEDASWDEYWGTGRDGKGKRKLTKILAQVRAMPPEELAQYRPDIHLADLKFYEGSDDK